MARAAKATNTTKLRSKSRKPGQPSNAAEILAKSTKPRMANRSTAVTVSVEKRKPGRPAKNVTAALQKPIRATKAPAGEPATLPASKVSKDELRGQIERLEQLVGTLRAKSRETNKVAKVAAARIAELEAQVIQLEKAAAAAPAPQPKLAKPTRPKRQGREIDPGDAVPPGVAVQEPAPLDEEAETALENLEDHLGHS